MSEVSDDDADDAGKNDWHLEKKVTISLIVSILLQTCAIVWWGSKLDSRVGFLEEKVTMEHSRIDNQEKEFKDAASRLARVEERTAAMLDILRRIEVRIDAIPSRRTQVDIPIPLPTTLR
jgi:hypothetical protein